MFFSQQRFAVTYLTSNGLTLYSEHGDHYYHFDFQKAFVADLEVKDKLAFEQQFLPWLTKIPSKPSAVVIILDASVIFEKSLGLSKPDEQNKLVQQFLDTVPISPDRISKVIVTSMVDAQVYVTNRELYQSIIAIFEKAKWRTLFVLPAPVFGSIGQTGSLSQTEVAVIKRLINKVSQADFLASGVLLAAPMTTQEAVPVPLHKHSFAAVALVIVLVLLTALIGYLIFSKRISLPGFGKGKAKTSGTTIATQSATPQQTASQSANQTPDVSQPSQRSFEKDKLKIQVLNASGIAGQATTVKNALVKQGFTSVETGNANVTSGSSTVSFNNSVDAATKAEIMTIIQLLFPAVTEKPQLSDVPFAVTITTAQ